ncbi:MAG: hypothetical protein IJ448_00870 [Oscillospiraceae bacterium]|nr:hypothetical protein [Oscillospiraceae bacterium]
MLDSIYMKLLDMTVAGSIVICIVLLFRLMLKKQPKIFSYCLWAVVLVRLLCPVTLSLPVSILPPMDSVSNHYTLADEDISFAGAGTAALNALSDAMNGGLDFQRIPLDSSPVPDSVPPTYVTCHWWEVWVLFGQYLWLAGLVTMAAISLWRFFSLRKKLREAVPLRDNIYIVDRIPSPFVMGLLRPKIYLTADLTEQEQTYILLHEQQHIRRGDHIFKALFYIALCLHWYNPLVWVAFLLSGRDMEMSCDEAVIGAAGEDIRADYSASLLRLSTGRASIAGAPVAFGEGDAGKRIRNLSKWKKPALWLSVLIALACIALVIVCAVDGTGKQDPSEPGNTEIRIPDNIDLSAAHDAEAMFVWLGEDVPEMTFTMPEYPNVTFHAKTHNGTSGLIENITAEKDGVEKILYGGWPVWDLYLCDLNGDGKRELCSTVSWGSGITDTHIVVYDYSIQMEYALWERMEYDYILRLQSGKLLADRYTFEYAPPDMDAFPKDPVNTGALHIIDRQLLMSDGSNIIPGVRLSPQINVDTLKVIFETAQQRISGGYDSKRISSYDSTQYYVSHYRDALKNSGGFISSGTGEIEFKKVVKNHKEIQYLLVIEEFRAQVYTDYVFYDPQYPERLFVCTEYRDRGYEDIESYYRSVLAGTCAAHSDTFLVRLDSLAIFRWGDGTNNLYPDMVS